MKKIGKKTAKARQAHEDAPDMGPGDREGGGEMTDMDQSGSGEAEILTLDDAAALLVQLEPNDVSELIRLQESLETIACDESLPFPARQDLARAAEKIREVVEPGDSDPDSSMRKIGEFIESAIDAMEERGGNDDIEPPEIPDDTVPDAGPIGGIAQAEALPEDSDSDLLAEFVTESNDLIQQAEEALLSLETDPEDIEAVGMVFRAFHTVKGVSAFLELTFIKEMAHHAESLLSRVRDGEIRYAGGYADLALRSLDMIKQMIKIVKGALGGEPLFRPAGYDDLLALLADPEAAGISDEIDDSTDMEPEEPRIGDILVAAGKAEREQVEETASVAVREERPIGAEMVKAEVATVTDVARALRTQKQIKGQKQVIESSVRVGTKRLDRLIDMVGELVIAHSMVAQDGIVANSDNHEFQKKVAQTSKIVRELQDLGMSMRMIPLKGTFNKMARLVRDVSRKMGKNVQLVTEGEETEVDRNMVDVISDPLMHMVRNSVDHGIETPEAREATGKPVHGTVKLSAYHSAGSVVVEIEDDGKGLDRETILAKAGERGLLDEGVSLSDREIFNMIFEPGFSTAKTVTDVSGRGVGMDVVKKNIDSLRGHVEIQSEPARGSVFKMKLPLTLAVIDGMIVRLVSETFIVPTTSIVTSIKPEEKDLSTILNQGEMLSLQGKLIPLFRLTDLFCIEDGDRNLDNKLVVVVEDDNKQAGLIVDELVGRQQIVIKSLGEAMSDIPGISGGAIMPDGQVGLILDVGGVVRLADSGNGDGAEKDL